MAGAVAPATHECPVIGCTKRVPNARLLCGEHWRALPKVYKNAIYAAYRPGQERTGCYSPSYARAVRAVVSWFATAGT